MEWNRRAQEPTSWYLSWVWSSWRATVPPKKKSWRFWIWPGYVLEGSTSSLGAQAAHQRFREEGYLGFQKVINADHWQSEFLWGPRAYAETTKMKILEFLAKVNGTDPSSFPSQYEEALQDEKEKAQARISANCLCRYRFLYWDWQLLPQLGGDSFFMHCSRAVSVHKIWVWGGTEKEDSMHAYVSPFCIKLKIFFCVLFKYCFF